MLKHTRIFSLIMIRVEIVMHILTLKQWGDLKYLVSDDGKWCIYSPSSPSVSCVSWRRSGLLFLMTQLWCKHCNLYWLWKISTSQDIVSVVANCWGSFHLSVIVLFSSSVFKLWQIEEGGKNADMEQASDVLQSQHKGSPLPHLSHFSPLRTSLSQWTFDLLHTYSVFPDLSVKIKLVFLQ